MFDNILEYMANKPIREKLGKDITVSGKEYLIVKETDLQDSEGKRFFLCVERGIDFAPVILLGIKLGEDDPVKEK